VVSESPNFEAVSHVSRFTEIAVGEG
jgi:hypothetical protein